MCLCGACVWCWVDGWVGGWLEKEEEEEEVESKPRHHGFVLFFAALRPNPQGLALPSTNTKT